MMSASTDSAADVLARTSSLPDRTRWAERVNAGARLQSTGDLVSARQIVEAVIAETRPIAEAGDHDAQFALSAALVNLATIHVARGEEQELARAATLLDDAERLATALGLTNRLGTIEVNRARIASLRGQVREQRDALARAEAHYRHDGTLADLAWAKRALGASLAAAGQLRDALALQREARDLYQEAGDQEQADGTEVGLLAIRAELGEQINAIERDRLEALSQRLPAEAAIQLTGNLANIAMKTDLDAAERLWRRARDRSRAEQRPVDEARAELSLAAVMRRRGQLQAALNKTQAAGERLRQLGAWQPAAHADVNAALLLGLLAEREPREAHELRRRATRHVVRAVERLDRLRHDLPSAAARRALLRGRYPQLFVAALEAALKAEEIDLAAALVERARIQPVLASQRPDASGFVEPPALATRPGAPAVAGQPPVIMLSSLAERLAGERARWLSWWHQDADLIRVDASPEQTRIETTPFPADARDQLDRALARIDPSDTDGADGDEAVASRLALRRAAAGPLIADPALAQRLERTLRRSNRTHSPDTAGLDELLWPLANATLGERLLGEVMRCDHEHPARLVLAPPRRLADVPWALLPLRASDRDEPVGAVPRLIDVAEIIVGLPAALAAGIGASPGGGELVGILDPLGDLPSAGSLELDGTRLGHAYPTPATRANVRVALERDVGMLIVCAHIRPGVVDDPSAAALLLADGCGGIDEFTVMDVARSGAPPTCVILGCDGSGGTVGDEWTGLATGLLWAGATWIVTSIWPTLEDRHSARLDAELIAAVRSLGPRHGLWSWQRQQLARWRARPHDPSTAPYRWAGMIACGRGSAAGGA